ncbi:MAG: hypothetical protein ACFE8V_04840 [Promethearchaeota archaeon]
MTKKGKYKLLSYLVESDLIFYKSLNKCKKLYAFSIIKVSSFYQLIPHLNKLMRRGYFYYYSIQIDTTNLETLIIFCFTASEKSKIMELFNVFYHKLIDYDKSIQIYKDKKLETMFINVILNNLNFNMRFLKGEGGIIIKNHLGHKILDIYKIILENHKNTPQIIIQLSNLIKNLNQKGYLILNFNYLINYVSLDAYLIHIIENNNIDQINIEKEVNTIFEFELIQKLKVDISNTYRILWRLNLTDTHFPYIPDNSSLLDMNNSKSINLQGFNLKFEALLKSNQIEFQRINQYLYFIEQKLVFLTLDKLNYKLILKIFKRFFSKYQIYLLILDENEYNKLLKMDKIKSLKNLEILNYESFKSIDIQNFKVV